MFWSCRLKALGIAAVALALILACLPLYAGSREGHQAKSSTDASGASATGGTPAYHPMPGPGEKVRINSDYYFVYGFDKNPKMGMSILKVSIYAKDGNKDVSMNVAVDSGMPSMRGAHDTGDVPMQLSRKKDYLQPIDIVMPGDWEIRITIKKEGKVIFRGSYRFDV